MHGLRVSVFFMGLIVLGTIGAASESHKSDRQGSPGGSLDSQVRLVLDQYARGDGLAIRRWILEGGGLKVIDQLPRLMTKMEGFRPALLAAFLLEVAVVQPVPGVELLLTAREDLHQHLGSAPGERSAHLLVLWDSAAMAVAYTHPDPTYLSRLLQAADRDPAGGGRDSSGSRLKLVYAMLASSVCCPPRSSTGTLVRKVPRSLQHTFTRERALDLYREAGAYEGLRLESHVRAGQLLLENGEIADAAKWLGAVTELRTSDTALLYAKHMLLGRLHDHLEEPHKAAGEYANATTVDPVAQEGIIGAAAAYLRAGLIDEAAKASESALRATVARSHLNREFTRGDARFLSEWLREIQSIVTQ